MKKIAKILIIIAFLGLLISMLFAVSNFDLCMQDCNEVYDDTSSYFQCTAQCREIYQEDIDTENDEDI